MRKYSSSTTINGVSKKPYLSWYNLTKYNDGFYPDEEFSDYGKFEEWYYDHVVEKCTINTKLYYKDGLVSRDTLVFLPRRFENLLRNAHTKVNKLALGVFIHFDYTDPNKKYGAKAHNKYLGSYPTIESAYKAVLERRYEVIKQEAIKAWNNNLITTKVMIDLINFRFK